MPSDEHHAEPCFALHHASVSISSLFERKCLDHGPDILQDAEGKRVLAIDRSTRQSPIDRASSKDKREGIQPNFVVWNPDYDQLASCCKTGDKWPHGITAGSCCENRSGPAQTLQHRCGILAGTIDVDVRAQIFRKLLLLASTSDRNRMESHLPRKLDTQMPKAANALHSDQVATTQAGVAKSVVSRDTRAQERRGFC